MALLCPFLNSQFSIINLTFLIREINIFSPLASPLTRRISRSQVSACDSAPASLSYGRNSCFGQAAAEKQEGLRKRMKQQLRTLIIDDEWLIRLELRRMLGQYAEINVVGEAANLNEAVQAVKELKPDLVFLDIQMPGGSGFDFLEQVEVNFKIIFVTAYTQHFARAKKYKAIDYLLKPISQDRLARAMQVLSNCQDR
jgi:CheY-like chemotaxis protein